MLAKAKKPMIFAGDGVAYSHAQAELTRVAELLGAEVWEADAGELNISTFETIGASERGRWKRLGNSC